MNARQTIAVTTLSALAALTATHAQGAITGVTGQTTWLGSPPASCAPGALTGFTANAWDEQSGVGSSALFVNMTNNPGTNLTAIPGVIAGTFDSHFIHFEGIPGVINAQGTVTFSAPIVAVIFRNTTLDATDALLGAGGTFYPTGYPFRGLSSNPPSSFSINANTLTFNLNSLAPTMEIDQIRVLTHHVPSPGAATLAGLGALAAFRRRRA